MEQKIYVLKGEDYDGEVHVTTYDNHLKYYELHLDDKKVLGLDERDESYYFIFPDEDALFDVKAEDGERVIAMYTYIAAHMRILLQAVYKIDPTFDCEVEIHEKKNPIKL